MTFSKRDSSSDEETPTCPLCLEELDATDLAVKACQCGYQVCLWCLHHIREQLNGKCPACRTTYEEENFVISEVDKIEATREARERAEAKRERERKERFQRMERQRAMAAAASEHRAKMNLRHARIIQKKMLYVIGLSLTLAREEVLKRKVMFGKFGKIVAIWVNRSHPYHVEAPGGPSMSAYIQFVKDSEASFALKSMNGEVFDGREIRCAIATTKYCDAYAKSGTPNHCGNPNCLYLHEPADSDLILTREEMLAGQYGPPPPAHLFQNRKRFQNSRSSNNPNYIPQGSKNYGSDSYSHSPVSCSPRLSASPPEGSLAQDLPFSPINSNNSHMQENSVDATNSSPVTKKEEKIPKLDKLPDQQGAITQKKATVSVHLKTEYNEPNLEQLTAVIDPPFEQDHYDVEIPEMPPGFDQPLAAGEKPPGFGDAPPGFNDSIAEINVMSSPPGFEAKANPVLAAPPGFDDALLKNEREKIHEEKAKDVQASSVPTLSYLSHPPQIQNPPGLQQSPIKLPNSDYSFQGFMADNFSAHSKLSDANGHGPTSALMDILEKLGGTLGMSVELVTNSSASYTQGFSDSRLFPSSRPDDANNGKKQESSNSSYNIVLEKNIHRPVNQKPVSNFNEVRPEIIENVNFSRMNVFPEPGMDFSNTYSSPPSAAPATSARAKSRFGFAQMDNEQMHTGANSSFIDDPWGPGKPHPFGYSFKYERPMKTGQQSAQMFPANNVDNGLEKYSNLLFEPLQQMNQSSAVGQSSLLGETPYYNQAPHLQGQNQVHLHMHQEQSKRMPVSYEQQPLQHQDFSMMNTEEKLASLFRSAAIDRNGSPLAQRPNQYSEDPMSQGHASRNGEFASQRPYLDMGKAFFN